MKNLTFLLWMLLHPICWAFAQYIFYQFSKTDYQGFSDNVKAISQLFELIIWIYIGIKLYEL